MAQVGPQNPCLTVLIPAYNEEKRLPETLRHVADYLQTVSWSAEILVMNDGSTDKTAAVVTDWMIAHPNVRLIDEKLNRGKGYVVREGVMLARGDYCLIYDADAATPIEEVARLLPLAERDRHAIVIGSRALASSETQVQARLYRKFMGRLFSALLFGLTPGIADTQCGFKLFHRETARPLFDRLTLKGYAFDVELLHMALRNRRSVIEVPVNWRHVPGSKINLVGDSLVMLLSLFRIGWQSLLGRYRL